MYHHGFCYRVYDFGGDNGSKCSTHVYCSLYNNHDHNGGDPGKLCGKDLAQVRFHVMTRSGVCGIRGLGVRAF